MSEQHDSIELLNCDLPSLVGLQESFPDLCIFTKSHPGYQPLLKPFNLNSTAKPLAIVVLKDAGELSAAVKYCTSQSPILAMTVRSGGHDLHGRYASDQAVLLDVSAINQIEISQDRKSVTVGTGVQSLELLRVLEAHGLSTATSWCGGVSVTGWAAGGGYGVTNGVWGLGVDNILGGKVITPGSDGSIVDTDEDAELLWAIRGAGLGNFGVISELRLKVYQRPKHLVGLLVFPLAEAKKVLLEGVQRLDKEGKMAGNFNGEFLVGNMPGLGPTLTFLWSWICDPGQDEELEQGRRLLGEFQLLGTVLLNTVSETSAVPVYELLGGTYTGGNYDHFYSAAVSELSSDLLDVMINNPPPANSFRTTIVFHHAHHRATRDDKGAVFHIRQPHYIFGLTSAAAADSSLEEREAGIRWAEVVFSGLTNVGFGMKEGYWSFSRPEHADVVSYFGRDKTKRLRALKEKYNPHNALPKAYPVL
ncbi:FAD binding domain protein [Rhypophila decipiens]